MLRKGLFLGLLLLSVQSSHVYTMGKADIFLKNIDAMVVNAKNYFENYQKNIEILVNPWLYPVDRENLLFKARGYAQSVADASVNALKLPIQEIATPELFNKVRDKGIELYAQCYLNGLWQRRFPLPDTALRVLTEILNKIYLSLGESDRITVRNQLVTDTKKYKVVMTTFVRSIEKKLETLKMSSSIPKDWVPSISGLITKIDSASASDKPNVVLGQSLSIIAVLSKLQGSLKNYVFFPFSKGYTSPIFRSSVSPTLRQVENFLGGVAGADELVLSQNATDLERFAFKSMAQEFGLLNGNFVLLDQVESIKSIESLLSFLRDAEANVNSIQYVWQVLDADTCPAGVRQYAESKLYSELKNKVTIFNSVNCKNKNESDLNVRLVAKADERYRLVPPMAPEQWLFAIPAIARRGPQLPEAFLPSISFIKAYLNRAKNVE